MSRDDWLFDESRRSAATERIYAAAAELILQAGMDEFSVDALAARTHCSRATIYRYAGGKKQIREAVLARSAARIVEVVRESVDGRTGADRVLTAIEVAVSQIRSDPAGQLFVDSARGGHWTWLTASTAVADFAAELTGIAGDDERAAQWIVRLVLSLLSWPGADPQAEHELLRRFVAPAFAAPAGHGRFNRAEAGYPTPTIRQEWAMAKDHGSSVKNDKQYEGLRKKGMSKSRAAAISNSEGASSRGGKSSGSSKSSKSSGSGSGGNTSQKKAAGRKGGKKSS